MQETKGTCCHKCGHVHVKGTSCPKPYLTGAKSCAHRKNEEKVKGIDGKACWKGYKYAGTENGKDKCVPINEMSLSSPDVKQILHFLSENPEIVRALGFPSYEDAQEYILDANVDEWDEIRAEIQAIQSSPVEALDELNEGEFCKECLMELITECWDQPLVEAEYRGRKVPLNKPMRGDVKKFKVYVKDPKTGNVKKVNFGDPNMRIKKSNPARRRSFRARHHCENPGPKTKARYWSCRKW